MHKMYTFCIYMYGTLKEAITIHYSKTATTIINEQNLRNSGTMLLVSLEKR